MGLQLRESLQGTLNHFDRLNMTSGENFNLHRNKEVYMLKECTGVETTKYSAARWSEKTRSVTF